MKTNANTARIRTLERRVARRRGGLVIVYKHGNRWSIGNGRHYKTREELIATESLAGRETFEVHIRADAPLIK